MILLVAAAVAASLFVARNLRIRLVKTAPENLMVQNFRGRRIPAVGGMVLAASLLAAAALVVLLLLASGGAQFGPNYLSGPGLSVHAGLMLLGMGFFALGTFDDLAGAGQAKGIRGHFHALRQGKVTAGALKAAGGLALAFVTAAAWELRLEIAVLDALIIAGAANLLNLLDLRPGRACKAFLIGWAPLALAALRSGSASYLPLSSALVAAVAVWLTADLGEEGMLGDAGANMLGAFLGAGIVLLAPPPVKIAALAVVLGLNLASEKVSFSAVFERFPPLRWLDGLGRSQT